MTSGPADRLIKAAAKTLLADVPATEAVLSVDCKDVEAVLHGQMDITAEPFAKGLGASPGAASGRVYFTADDAADAYDRGEDIILVAVETSPEDVHGMELAEGILTTRGGLASHAAVVARGWGKPAVCGASDIEIVDKSLVSGDTTVYEGQLISIDGTTGLIFVGAGAVVASDPPPELEVILRLADQVRQSKLAVRANADNGVDAAKARAFGAEGIGLCRTEHMFLGDRLPALRRVITASNDAQEAAGLAALLELQQKDFEEIFEAMDGLPVTIRLLDAPLHEFCPDIETLVEVNPMLGTRGVRLGILRPQIFKMQVQAVLGAVSARLRAGGDPQPEIMVPLIINQHELALVRGWILDEIDAAGLAYLEIPIGAMLETPRAVLSAADIAGHADFFSFGTNDLTQMTFGFSRDDVEASMMAHYLEHDLLPCNPFQTLDSVVFAQVKAAAEGCRSANKNFKLGVCGEHGGDPASIAKFYEAGLDYVSCSPYRVPVARLAAAQAIAAHGQPS